VVVVFTEASRGGPSAPGLVLCLGGFVEGGPLGLRQENGGVVVLVGEGRGRGLGSRGREPSRRGAVEDERRGRRQGGTPDSLRARYRKGFSKWMPGSAAISMYGARSCPTGLRPPAGVFPTSRAGMLPQARLASRRQRRRLLEVARVVASNMRIAHWAWM
jgi:hypothetical protein